MKISSLFRSASNYIENPELFYLRTRGVTASHYLKYGQPWIRELNPLTVLDVGANIGQSAIAFNALFPDAEIYSFEPIPHCYDTMVSRTKSFPRIHPLNLGLGDISGETDFEMNDFSGSSSFLSLSGIHKEVFSYAQNTKNIKVKVEKLDIAALSLKIQFPIIIKIDVQGFEDKVIKGGENVVSQSSLIIVETSFEHLYEQQPLFQDVYNILGQMGFQYKGSLENMYEPITGRILQSDSLFVKQDRIIKR
jgi:FkbM family methyltransferase